MRYGEWEGLTIHEIVETRPDEARARDADKWGFSPPGGESYARLAERTAEWLKALNGPTFIVAHGGVLRALMHLLAGLPGHDAPHLAVPQDRVTLFTRQIIVTI